MNQLHYPGNQCRFDPGHIVGPDQFDCFYKPTSAVYDLETDRTTITYTPIPRAELPPEAIFVAGRALSRRQQLEARAATLGSRKAIDAMMKGLS